MNAETGTSPRYARAKMTSGGESLGHVAVLSAEPWDEVWRRNQHLASQLVGQRLCERLTFVEPPVRGRALRRRNVASGIEAVTPPLPIPRTLGGLTLTARVLRKAVLADVDVLWINDPVLGRLTADAVPVASYDVTDDWRTSDLAPRIRRRLVGAEDFLAAHCGTIVCSATLADRWLTRYGVRATVVQNGTDVDGMRRARPATLPGAQPHAGYIGTLHDERLDVPLVLAVGDDPQIGTVHLVGPDALTAASRERLRAHPKIRLHGPVPATDVPSWTVAMDLLLCPHLVTEFTLSLDALKAYEYLASGRPVVATPTSGFQQLVGEPGVLVRESTRFVAALGDALQMPVRTPSSMDLGWARRAREFAAALGGAAHPTTVPG
ncbi:MAG: teichuronic acid biosynthesis glycosyltransferase TuaH [Actinomycetota bacterium]|nr:teichuronic acid biosynthesis glycosyltransferase TuaH [Actinomycetota bacterium]